MKNLVFYLFLIFGFISFSSCDERMVDPGIPDHVVLPDHAAPNFGLPPTMPPGQIPDGLLLWNQLDSTDEQGIVPSAFGPDGLTSGLVNFSNEVMFSQGMTPNEGHARAGVDFDATLLDPNAGTIEMWSMFFENPVPYRYGVYGFVNTAYQSTVTPIRLYWHNPDYMIAHVYFGGERVTIIQGAFNPPLNTPVHVAISWDKSGIEGTEEFIRIYVDGEVFALANESHWGNGNNGQLRIGCVWDRDYTTDRYAVDNVRIYNYAKTDFSDRFVEKPPKKTGK